MFGLPPTKDELYPPPIPLADIDTSPSGDDASGHPLAALQANCTECQPPNPATLWESPPIQYGVGQLGDARRTPALLEQLPLELLGECRRASYVYCC